MSARLNVSLLRASVGGLTIGLFLCLTHLSVNAQARRCPAGQMFCFGKYANEGLNFTEIFQALRRDLAVRYLDDRKLHVSKIAWLLGFSRGECIHHAFKRWTGKTPRQMRTARAY